MPWPRDGRLGEMLGGDRGRQLVAQTEEWMTKATDQESASDVEFIGAGIFDSPGKIFVIA